MALTGKTIGQLTYLSGVTTDTLFPVELSGDTYHIAYSEFTNSNYNEGTYDELYSFATGGTLTAGSYYLMTDFQTCYDQPNYNSIGDPITTGNYKTGTTEPILLLATSTTGFSPTVYSTLYPQDKISYDINWNLTEVTSSPAKGRITERIDDKNNRADYDFKAVQFIRYVGYFSERYYTGKINLNGATGLVESTGTGTQFTNDFTVGDIFGIYIPDFGIGSFQYYEVSSIVSDTEMYVTGRTLSTVNNAYYSAGQRLPDYMNPFQCNITGTTNDEFAEYYTFNNDNNFNTYLGDNINYNTFILSNNVFLSGSYRNNTFGGNVVGNTLNDDMDSNIIAPYCQYNIITNDFDKNSIGSNFQYNIIDCDMESNQIGSYFQFNMFGDSDGQDFDYNRIGSFFASNFLTFNNSDFQNNNIGENFYGNIIDSGFLNNSIVGDFYQNLIINQSFNDNFIGDNFYSNIIPSTFDNNTIGNEFYNNNIYNTFNQNSFGDNVNTNTFGDSNNTGVNTFSNNTIGGDFISNDISGDTQYNTIGFNCNNNTVYWDLQYNTILNEFNTNTIGDVDNLGGIFESNQIMNNFKGNDIQSSYTDNQVKTNFKGNNIIGEFRYNNVGFGGVSNIFSGETIHNNIGDDFSFNTCYGLFSYNTIGTNFYSNVVQDGFGFGGGTYQGNRIGNNFNNNDIGEYFYNNTIPDNFTNNTIGNYFQWNAVNTAIGSVDFTVNYGNITGITYTATGTTATNGTYTGVGGTTAGSGVGALFTINVSGTSVSGVTVTNGGKLYLTGETITVLGSQIGGVNGADNVIITVTDLGPIPTVYEPYSSNIFKNSSSIDKVSYIDASGNLVVDDVDS